MNSLMNCQCNWRLLPIVFPSHLTLTLSRFTRKITFITFIIFCHNFQWTSFILQPWQLTQMHYMAYKNGPRTQKYCSLYAKVYLLFAVRLSGCPQIITKSVLLLASCIFLLSFSGSRWRQDSGGSKCVHVHGKVH